jgi:hypothetical protein
MLYNTTITQQVYLQPPLFQIPSHLVLLWKEKVLKIIFIIVY